MQKNQHLTPQIAILHPMTKLERFILKHVQCMQDHFHKGNKHFDYYLKTLRIIYVVFSHFLIPVLCI